MYRRVNEAYSVLSDERRRDAYDDVLANHGDTRAPIEIRQRPRSEHAAPLPSQKMSITMASEEGRRYLALAQAASAKSDLDGARLYLTFAQACEPQNDAVRAAISDVVKRKVGGEDEIRTHDRVAPILV